MFFHKHINALHCDTHGGNFLYHKIKPGGYFHYNLYGKDYYLENIGFLWVIWDFGLINPFHNSLVVNNNKYGKTHIVKHKYTLIITEYLRIIESSFVSRDKYDFSDYITFIINKLTNILYNPLYNNNTDVKYFPLLDNELINALTIKVFFNTFKTSINADDIIINPNNPYFI